MARYCQLLFERACAQGDAAQGDTFAHQQADVDVALHATHCGQEDDTAPWCKCFQILFEVGGTDEVKDDMNTLAVSETFHLGGKLFVGKTNVQP